MLTGMSTRKRKKRKVIRRTAGAGQKVQTREGLDVAELRGLLFRRGARSVSLEEMDAAIAREHARRR